MLSLQGFNLPRVYTWNTDERTLSYNIVSVKEFLLARVERFDDALILDASTIMKR